MLCNILGLAITFDVLIMYVQLLFEYVLICKKKQPEVIIISLIRLIGVYTINLDSYMNVCARFIPV